MAKDSEYHCNNKAILTQQHIEIVKRIKYNMFSVALVPLGKRPTLPTTWSFDFQPLLSINIEQVLRYLGSQCAGKIWLFTFPLRQRSNVVSAGTN